MSEKTYYWITSKQLAGLVKYEHRATREALANGIVKNQKDVKKK